MYPVLDFANKMMDIPLRDDHAIVGSDSEEDDPLLYEDCCQHPGDQVYFDEPADMKEERASQMCDSDEEDPLLQRDRYQDPSEQYYADYENDDVGIDQSAAPDDVEMTHGEQEGVELGDREEGDFDHEIVFYGDEDTAEHGALARRNDGIQNVRNCEMSFFLLLSISDWTKSFCQFGRVRELPNDASERLSEPLSRRCASFGSIESYRLGHH